MIEDGPSQPYPFLEYLSDCVIRLDQRVVEQVRTRRLRVLKYRGSGFLSNEYPYVILEGGIVLLPVSMTSLEYAAPGPRVSTGNAALDEISGGGYRQGTCVLVVGLSGTGKTTLVSTFAAAACGRGERVLYVSFEESAGSLISGMGNVGIGLGGWQERGLLTILTAMPEAAGVEEHLVRLFRTMDVVGPKHVVVDAISACRRMGSEVAAFDFLVRLLTRCKDRGITCLFTNQGSADIAQVEVSGLGISSLVDVLVTLHYHEENGEMGRQVQVLKSRGSRHSTRRHRFRITDGGMEVDADGRFGARKGGR
jgi:circadian clock protein KaiC